MQAAKEKMENMASSARAGMEKTKATVQEKAEKMTASHPAEKVEAEREKEGRKMEAEVQKQAEIQQHKSDREEKAAANSGGLTTAGQTAKVTTGPDVKHAHGTIGLSGQPVNSDRPHFA